MIRPFARLVVTVPGTLVRATSQEADPAKHIMCHGVMFQVLPTNVGRVYIGTSALNRAALTNCFAWLPVPTINQAPTFSAALTIAPNGLAVGQYYVDADNGGDGVIMTVLVA
jgi:hypothetical protein